jgi:hypothetical protein
MAENGNTNIEWGQEKQRAGDLSHMKLRGRVKPHIVV